MRAHLCFSPAAIPDSGSHRLPSPAEGVLSWLLASGQSDRKCLFIVMEKVPRLKHAVRVCRSETSQDLICQQLSGAYTVFKELGLLNGCSYETGNQVGCIFINGLFRNAVNNFGNSAFS